MHDMDRTTLEMNGFDYEEAFEMDEEMDYEMDDQYDDEFDDEYDDEFDDEYDDEMYDEYDDEYDEMDDEMSGAPFSEEEEAEMAFELLSVQSPEEMDEFLGKLIKKASKGIRSLKKNPFKFVKRNLRKVARYALPVAGRTVGNFFGGPIGGKLGGKFGKLASRFFEIEMEGLSPEDQEFEIARRFVRLGGATARAAMRNARRMSPAQAARRGLRQAARRHAPGMLKPRRSNRKNSRGVSGGAKSSGRWIRKGDRILIMGL